MCAGCGQEGLFTSKQELYVGIIIIILHLHSFKKQLLNFERDLKWQGLELFLFIQLT